MQAVRESGEAKDTAKNNFKKNKSFFKKVLDKSEKMWYNSQAVHEEQRTVIENWTTREKYKA